MLSFQVKLLMVHFSCILKRQRQAMDMQEKIREFKVYFVLNDILPIKILHLFAKLILFSSTLHKM